MSLELVVFCLSVELTVRGWAVYWTVAVIMFMMVVVVLRMVVSR